MGHSTNLRICLLTEYFPPEPGAGSSRAFEHAKAWTNMGIEVTVLTCMPHYPTGKISAGYEKRVLIKEKIHDIKVIRTLTYATASKGFFRRFLNYFTFMLSSILQGWYYLENVDYIIATSPPFSIGISGWVLSKLKKTDLVFEVRDLWPDSLVQLKQIKNKYLIKLLEKIEYKIYEDSKIIISVTDSYCKIIESKNINKNKIKVVKNGVDTEFFYPQKKDEGLASFLNLNNNQIISYFGNFGLSQPINLIIDIARLLENNNKIHFLLVGDGEIKSEIRAKIVQYKLENVTLIDTVSKKELIRYYSISDLMLVPLQNIPLFEAVIPSKIFEIMAMRKPILFNVNGETRKLLEDAEAGVYVDFFNVTKSKEMIEVLLNNEEKLKLLALNGRTFVEKYYSRTTLAKNLINYLQKTH